MNVVLPVTAGTSAVVATAAVLYRLIRPRFPVKVNCWFCSRDHVVPYGNQNCWDCPDCEQYNGFTQDGGYNKPIPAQYTEDLNHPMAGDSGSGMEFNSASQVLCVNCSRNQQLKVRQLANFVPYNEADFDVESESYKQQLDQVYRLCRACEIRVQKVLRKQDLDLQQRLRDLDRSNNQLDLSNVSDDSMCTSHIQCCLSTPRHIRSLRLTSLLCAFTLLLVNVHQLTRHSQLPVKFDSYLSKGFVWYLELLVESGSFLVLLGATAMMAAVFSGGKDRLLGVDAVSCFLWLAMFILHSAHIKTVVPASDLYLLQAFVSVATAVFVFWCAVCKRYGKTSRIRIRTRRKRHHHNHSAVSSTTGSPDSSPASSLAGGGHDDHPAVTMETVHNQVQPTHEPACRNQLEGMTLGPLQRSPKPGVFSEPSFCSVSSTTSTSTSPMRNHANPLDGLRNRRPIISPARLHFRPPTSTPAHSNNARPKLFQAQAQDGQSAGFSGADRLFSFDRPPPNTGFAFPNAMPYQAPIYASSTANDDTASVFSEARGTQGSDDDSRDSSHHSSHDSDNDSQECAVGTTTPITCLVGNLQTGPKKKSSLLFRCFTGISIGLGLCLLLFYYFDIRQYFNSMTYSFILSRFLPPLAEELNNTQQ